MRPSSTRLTLKTELNAPSPILPSGTKFFSCEPYLPVLSAHLPVLSAHILILKHNHCHHISTSLLVVEMGQVFIDQPVLLAVLDCPEPRLPQHPHTLKHTHSLSQLGFSPDFPEDCSDHSRSPQSRTAVDHNVGVCLCSCDQLVQLAWVCGHSFVRPVGEVQMLDLMV